MQLGGIIVPESKSKSNKGKRKRAAGVLLGATNGGMWTTLEQRWAHVVDAIKPELRQLSASTQGRERVEGLGWCFIKVRMSNKSFSSRSGMDAMALKKSGGMGEARVGSGNGMQDAAAPLRAAWRGEIR